MNRPDGDNKLIKKKNKKGNKKVFDNKTKSNKVSNQSKPKQEVLDLDYPEYLIKPNRQSEYFDANSEISEFNNSSHIDESSVSFKSLPLSPNSQKYDSSVSENDYVSLNSTLESKTLESISESLDLGMEKSNEVIENSLDKTKVNDSSSKLQPDGDSFRFEIPSFPASAIRRDSNLLPYDDTEATVFECSETKSIKEVNSYNVLDDTLNLVDDLPVDSESISNDFNSHVKMEARTSSEINMEIPSVDKILLNINLEINIDNEQVKGPDLPENVRIQTKVILSSLVKRKLRNEIISDDDSQTDEISNTLPIDGEINSLPLVIPGGLEDRAAKCVADLGDRIMALYENRLNEMIEMIPDDLCPMDMFRQVANQIFKLNSLPNWGQIVTLMYFGYLLVRKKINNGLLNAFRQITECIQSLFQEANVFIWIAGQGGWRILEYLRIAQPGSENNQLAQLTNTANSVMSFVNDVIVNNSNHTSAVVVTLTITYAIYLLCKKLFRN